MQETGRAPHSMRRRKVLLIVLAVVLLALVGVWYLSNYHTWEYSGDGWIDEKRYNIHFTRYDVYFPRVWLSEPGEHTFRCRGLPPAPMWLQLRITGIDAKEWDYGMLSGLKTRVRFQVFDESGGALHSTDGPLGNWHFSMPFLGVRGEHGYVPSIGSLKFARFTEYRLKLTISDIDPASPRMRVEPMLTNASF